MVKAALPRVTTVIGGVHVTAMPEQTMREFPSSTSASSARAKPPSGSCARRSGTAVRRSEYTGCRCGPRMESSSASRATGLAIRIRFPSRPGTCCRCRGIHPHDAARLPVQLSLLHEPQRPDGAAAVDRQPHGRAGWCWTRSSRTTLVRRRALLREHGSDHEILDAMIAAGVPNRVYWSAQTHVHSVDLPLLRKMKQAGAWRLGMGIETGDAEVLKETGKGATPEMIMKASAPPRGRAPDRDLFHHWPSQRDAGIDESDRRPGREGQPGHSHLRHHGPFPGTEWPAGPAGEAGYG